MTIAWGSSGSLVQKGYFELADEYARLAIQRILQTAPKMIFHNAKFDLQKLVLAGIIQRNQLSADRILDTECLSQLLDEHRKKKLKTLARDLLGLSTNEEEVLARARRKLKLTKLDGYDKLPRNILVPYAMKDADYTLRLFWYLWPLIAKDSQLLPLFYSEMELVLAVLDVEAAGNRLDIPYLKQATKEVRTSLLIHQKTIERLTELTVWYPEKQGQKTPEGCINLNSPIQVLEALANRGHHIDNTRNETLTQLDDDLARSIVALRGDKKLLDYLLAMDRERLGDIIHPNFRLFEPKTGRMSSGKAEE